MDNKVGFNGFAFRGPGLMDSFLLQSCGELKVLECDVNVILCPSVPSPSTTWSVVRTSSPVPLDVLWLSHPRPQT